MNLGNVDYAGLFHRFWTSAMIEVGSVPRALESSNMVTKVGCALPRSILEMKVRCRSLSTANRS
jgi:hypothetical protein